MVVPGRSLSPPLHASHWHQLLFLTKEPQKASPPALRTLDAPAVLLDEHLGGAELEHC